MTDREADKIQSERWEKFSEIELFEHAAAYWEKLMKTLAEKKRSTQKPEKVAALARDASGKAKTKIVTKQTSLTF